MCRRALPYRPRHGFKKHHQLPSPRPTELSEAGLPGLTPGTISPRDLPLPPGPTSTAPGAAPQAVALLYRGRLASRAVTQEVVPCPRLPPSPSTLLVRKNGGWARVAANGRRECWGEERGTQEEAGRPGARGGEPGRPAPRGQDGGAGGGPGVRRGRGHSPSAPAARGRPGQDSGSPGTAAGGEGSGREGRGGRGPAHYAKRPPPPPPPRGKGKRPRSASAASMAAQACPPPRRDLARRACSYLRVGCHNNRGAGPVSAAGAPGTEGRARTGQAPEGRSPGARAAGTPRRAGAERGGGPGPGAARVAEGPRFVIVFVSERSEFVTPVPLPPPPARWEEEGECSSSSSRRQPHRGGGGRASTRLAERARAPERRRCRSS